MNGVMNGDAYILRQCRADITSKRGFKWPSEGLVEAPDWDPTPECGFGLHGWLWGEGYAESSPYLDDDDAVWIVARVDPSEVVDLGGKVKFPRCWVVYAGDRETATQRIVSLGARGAVIGGTATAGDLGTATAGDRGTATAGDRGTATAGDHGTATAGDHGTATAGEGGEIRIRWWDGSAYRYRVAVGYVGENGIRPRVAYRVVDGQLVEAAS